MLTFSHSMPLGARCPYAPVIPERAIRSLCIHCSQPFTPQVGHFLTCTDACRLAVRRSRTSCWYCNSSPATQREHPIPRSWDDAGSLEWLPACNDCNSVLSCIGFTFEERLLHLAYRLERRLLPPQPARKLHRFPRYTILDHPRLYHLSIRYNSLVASYNQQ